MCACVRACVHACMRACMGFVHISITWGGGVLAIVTFFFKSFFIRLAVDIRLIAMIVMSMLGYISKEFKEKEMW